MPVCAKNVKIVSLGCVKNLSDAQGMAGMLLAAGWRLTDDAAAADVFIINTCSFIKAARDESSRMIEETIAAASKGGNGRPSTEASATKASADRRRGRPSTETRRGKQVIVTGCWAQGDPGRLLLRYPQVKAFVGTGELSRIVDILESSGGPRIVRGKPGGWLSWEGRKNLIPAGGSASLRISGGCSNGCTFCTIPRLRGPFRSREFGDILREAEDLARAGVREINLIGQDTTAYGAERYGRKRFAELLDRLCRYRSFRFIRILYAYPKNIDDRLLSIIRERKQICRYLDIPLQHIAAPVLKIMGRRMDEKATRGLIENICREVPGITLRTSFITGFPGETVQDFKKLVQYVGEGWFVHVGVFTYSREPGTKAGRYRQTVPERVKEERRRELLAAQKEVVRKRNRMRRGSTVDVLVTGADGRRYAGRSEHEAPGVDGMILFGGHKTDRVHIGDIRRVCIERFREYDCYGSIIR